MRKLVAAVAGVVLAVGTAVVAAQAAPASAAPYCGITWGSTDKAGTVPPTAPAPKPQAITAVRAGQQDCYDRLVVDLRATGASYRVRYVTNVYTEGEGAVVPLRGGAKLEIVMPGLPTYDLNTGASTYRPARPSELVDVTGYQTFRQIALAGSFEAQTTVGLGVRARLPFRVLYLDGPGAGSRLVIDVAHQW
jgi:hypothetical protein